MKFAFVLDPPDTLKPYKDSSVAMMREAARRGHDVFAIAPDGLSWQADGVQAVAHRLILRDSDEAWYEVQSVQRVLLAGFDAIVVRKDPPFDAEYLYATQLLSLSTDAGIRVWNTPQILRDWNEKIAITRFSRWCVPTLISRDPEQLRAFAAEQRDVIVKPLDGMGGAGIFRVREDGLNLNSILETLGGQGTRTLMMQKYIPAVTEGDKRVLLIAGQVVPWALARIPAAGETRANLAAGGTGVAMPLTEREQQIASDLAPVLWSKGILLAGLDIIGGYLTEINITSPTGMVEIGRQTGFSPAAMLVDALEQTCVPGAG